MESYQPLVCFLSNALTERPLHIISLLVKVTNEFQYNFSFIMNVKPYKRTLETFERGVTRRYLE